MYLITMSAKESYESLMMAVMDVDLLLGIEQALLLPLLILFYACCSCHQLASYKSLGGGGHSPFIRSESLMAVIIIIGHVHAMAPYNSL